MSVTSHKVLSHYQFKGPRKVGTCEVEPASTRLRGDSRPEKLIVADIRHIIHAGSQNIG